MTCQELGFDLTFDLVIANFSSWWELDDIWKREIALRQKQKSNQELIKINFREFLQRNEKDAIF